MGKYVAKRIGYMALVFLIVSFLMYSLYNLIPTDPARAELEAQKQSLKPAEYEQLYQELRAKMGLDDPLVIRYMRWMGLWPDVGDNNGFNGLLQGNFGYSQFYKKDVTEVIVDPMKNTIFINIFSTILALAITIPLGIFCAVHKGKKVDNTVQVVTMLGYSLPIYIIALIFMFFFCVLWRIFPISGTKTAGAIYATKWDEFIDMLYHITLPVIVMTFASLGGMTRYVRSAMIDALSMDYIRTARAKGLKEKVVIYSHAWRNALLPVITPLLEVALQIVNSVIMPLLPPLMQLIEALLPPVVSLLNAIMPLLSPLLAILEPIASVLGTIVGWVSKIVSFGSGVISKIAGLFGGGGGGSANVSGYATGGFTSGPSIAGEDPRYPTEAVISFNPAYRAQNLSYWARAGEMLGAMDEGSYEPISSGSGTSVVYDLSGLSFSPTIKVDGNTDEDALIRKLRDLEPEFIDFILEALARREGGAYVTADSRLY